jgi:hypothetical protein
MRLQDAQEEIRVRRLEIVRGGGAQWSSGLHSNGEARETGPCGQCVAGVGEVQIGRIIAAIVAIMPIVDTRQTLLNYS